MFKRNSGRFTHKITLRRPSASVRDELGGIMPTTYEDALTLYAMCESKSQSRQQVIGAFVTTDTRYFVIRDIRSICHDINTEWQLVYNGYTFDINQIELIDESRPYYIQITATAINVKGGVF